MIRHVDFFTIWSFRHRDRVAIHRYGSFDDIRGGINHVKRISPVASHIHILFSAEFTKTALGTFACAPINSGLSVTLVVFATENEPAEQSRYMTRSIH